MTNASFLKNDSPVGGLTRIRRQIGSSSGKDQDQTYQLEISFPTIDNEEVTNEDGKRVRQLSIYDSESCL